MLLSTSIKTVPKSENIAVPVLAAIVLPIPLIPTPEVLLQLGPGTKTGTIRNLLCFYSHGCTYMFSHQGTATDFPPNKQKDMHWIGISNPSTVRFHKAFRMAEKNTSAGQALDTSHLDWLANSSTHTPHSLTTAQLTTNSTNQPIWQAADFNNESKQHSFIFISCSFAISANIEPDSQNIPLV